jgi:hypothetical protein
MRTFLVVFEFPFKGVLIDLIDVIKKIQGEKLKDPPQTINTSYDFHAW